MNTSNNWLSDYINIGSDTEGLADTLTMAGLEVEEITEIGDLQESIIVGEILERNPHPDADKLSLCTVSNGSETLQVVCGAPNCDAGKKVAFAQIGTDFGDFKIKKAKLRGQESFGMLCSESELGLGDGHDGIMILDDNATVGSSLKVHLGTDTMIEWEVTPNRPDWLSHIGIAREISAMTGAKLTIPEIVLSEVPGNINELLTVKVEDVELCSRYMARYIKNVKVGPSPKWMQDYLNAVGLRPINNIVDITNFVLMECGQPLHAFDARLVKDNTIIVRRAKHGEKTTTLDGTELELTTENLLICEGEKGIALAGIMGGANSEIREDTTDVILESAAFNAVNIRASSKKLKISSDSSYRFERGCDFNMVEYASKRAAALLCEYAGGELVEGCIDEKQSDYQAHSLDCRYARVNKIVGITITPDTVKGILELLGLTVTDDCETHCTVTVPSFRLDLGREIDLIEEVARIHGYDKIPAKTPEGILGGWIKADEFYGRQQFTDSILSLGLNECVHIGMVSNTDAELCAIDSAEWVELSNPLSLEYAIMRPGLFASLLSTVARNISRGNDNLALFELGRVFKKDADEELQCCIALTGLKQPGRYSAELEDEYDFYDLSGLITDLCKDLHVDKMTIEKSQDPLFENGICASVKSGGIEIAVIGQIKKKLTKSMRIKHPLFVGIVNAEKIISQLGKTTPYSAVSQFPAVSRDVAFLAPSKLKHADVVNLIEKLNIKILSNIHLFDIFEDEAFGDKKSMAFSFTFRVPDRTLTDKEVNKAHDKIKTALENELGAEIR